MFEQRYKAEFLRVMEEYNQKNLWARYCQLPAADRDQPELVAAMRHYDRTVNITWVMAHYHAAKKYLESGEKPATATGGSDWQRYMLPRYQRRIFFPKLWTTEELDNWGMDVE
jgi:tryptophan 2,3-dioxygenase